MRLLSALIFQCALLAPIKGGSRHLKRCIDIPLKFFVENSEMATKLHSIHVTKQTGWGSNE